MAGHHRAGLHRASDPQQLPLRTAPALDALRRDLKRSTPPDSGAAEAALEALADRWAADIRP
ncbi:hypothetical protein L843_5555 [Mycobacterium intracellulare MIN_061107_1834]|nr:hypothetical protein L843_5555 [Mycobacterium intracellulare MIN_061107_1834]